MAATLTWGVKESFRNYVAGAGGEIETGAGAGRDSAGAFTFTAAADDALRLGPDGKPTGQGRFTGEVRMNAHGGMLKVAIADPHLEIGPSEAALTVIDNGLRNPRRVEFAKLDLAAATTENGELVIPVLLSLDGCSILGDHYPPRSAIDPVRVKPAG